MEFKSSGTEMTLSDRFAQVRETMKKQALATNPFIGISSGKPTKNFGERFTRDQRPNASQQAASLANRNLVYQMSRQPALMAEVGHLSQPVFVSTRQARVSRHSFVGEYGDDETIATTFTVGQSHFRGRANVPITQRLGLRLAGAVTKNKASVYSRLGTKPIHLRLGSRPRAPMVRASNINNRFQNPRPSQARVANRNKGPKRLARKAPKPVTAEQLDDDLDTYMSNQMES